MSASGDHDGRHLPDDLRPVVERWNELSEAVRSGILAMVLVSQ